MQRPPCASMIVRLMARPIPMPWGWGTHGLDGIDGEENLLQTEHGRAALRQHLSQLILMHILRGDAPEM
jgi:hypothetical protein